MNPASSVTAAQATAPRPETAAHSASALGLALHVLHLEDNRLDAEIVHRLFGSEFPGSKIRVVASRLSFLDELKTRAYDLIVSDFSLDAFNGFEALELTRQHAPQIPFVFYSGTIGDERAVQAMHYGARDCVPKGQLQRLAAAIRRTFDHSEESRRIHQLEQHNRSLEASLNESLAVNEKLEEQAGRVHRLENIGLLAAGVAHDLNNVLSPMLMAVPMLRETTTDADARRLLDTLERSVKRGALLVSQIVAVARGGNAEARPVQPDVLLREIARVVTETFPRNLQIEEFIPTPLWQIRAVPAHLSQIVLNLCLNARDAMPSGGTLTLGAENCRVDDMTARLIAGARPGAFVMLRVEDTGSGIAPDVLQAIWEPSVKRKGTGVEAALGLPTVRAIVKRHGGFVQVQTAIGLGSSFRVFLPALPGKLAGASGGSGKQTTAEQ